MNHLHGERHREERGRIRGLSEDSPSAAPALQHTHITAGVLRSGDPALWWVSRDFRSGEAQGWDSIAIGFARFTCHCTWQFSTLTAEQDQKDNQLSSYEEFHHTHLPRFHSSNPLLQISVHASLLSISHLSLTSLAVVAVVPRMRWSPDASSYRSQN